MGEKSEIFQVKISPPEMGRKVSVTVPRGRNIPDYSSGGPQISR
jgi:hypothetical protein